MDRHDWSPTFLGKKDNSLARLVNRPARSVRRHENVSVGRQSIDQLTQSDDAFARTGAANRAVARPLDESRDQVSIPAGADQAVTLARRKAGIENAGQHEQAIMP